MKKKYDEEYEFTIEVTGFLHGDHTERCSERCICQDKSDSQLIFCGKRGGLVWQNICLEE